MEHRICKHRQPEQREMRVNAANPHQPRLIRVMLRPFFWVLDSKASIVRAVPVGSIMSRSPSVTTGTKLSVAEATLIPPVIGLALGSTKRWNACSSFHRV